MHEMIQNSTCKTDKKRFVVKRTLDSLDRFSGLSGVFNGEKGLKDIKAGLEFASRSVLTRTHIHSHIHTLLLINKHTHTTSLTLIKP